jgi:glycosyltransferase involved in cell wall biosynthesis
MNRIPDNVSIPHVVVALSTYNGEKYLGQQLDSLVRQDYQNYRIVIRDDGSTDSTVLILKSYCKRYPQLFTIISPTLGNIGVTRSFLSLLDHSDGNACMMFCDQDDVWFDGKISAFVERLTQEEKRLGQFQPILVFGDMVVTNETLKECTPSFWRYQRLDVKIAHDWKRVMMSNVVTGCSSLLNPMAVAHLKKAPVLPLLHDHLAAIMIAKDGVLVPLPQPTMFYRQHDSNIEGARSFGLRYLLGRLGRFLWVIVPRYYRTCRAFNVSIPIAAYLKVESIFRRLCTRRSI